MKKYALLLLFVILTALQLEAHVNLKNPVGGETFNPGDTVNIQWSILVTHSTLNWDLYYSIDGGATWNNIQLNIATSVLNYQWIVPPMVTTQGKIRVVMNNVGANYNDVSGNFAIELKEHVNLKNPFGGETFNHGDTVNVKWEIVTPHSTLNWDLLFSSNGGSSWDTIQKDISVSTLNYQWIVPTIATSVGKIKIVMDNVGANYEDKSKKFTILVNNHVVLKNPVGGETYNFGDTVNISWKIIVPHASFNWDLLYSSNGGSSWDTIQKDISSVSLGYQWIAPPIATTQGIIKVVMDNVGMNFEDVSSNFNVVNEITAINEFFTADDIFIYPNPLIDYSILKFNNPRHENLELTIYNNRGQLVKTLANISSDNVVIERNKLLSGLYFIHLRSDNKIYASGKLIVK